MLEVGFGMGDNLNNMIAKNKEAIFIGCEPYLNGVANFLSEINESDYNRVKIFNKDVRILLDLLPNNFFSKVILLFPDPWIKRRHKKRRLFGKLNINLFLKALNKNGEVYFGTDVENYFLEVEDFFLKRKESFLIKNSSSYNKIPNLLSETKYAKKSLEKGILPKYLVVKKKVDIL